MSNGVDLSWQAKIQRANESIKNLESEITLWVNSDPRPYRIVSKLDHEKRAYTFTAFSNGPIPQRFSVLTGEIIHHLRDSLDHLVWKLALKRIPNPSTKTHFPICDTAEKFKTACDRGELKGVSASARAIIDSVQPYRKDKPRFDPLAVLNRLSNIDKHRLLLVVSNFVVLGDTIEIAGGEDHETEVIGMSPPPDVKKIGASEHGTEVFAVHFGKYSPKTSVKASFTVTISLDEFGPGRAEPLIASLNFISGAVANTIRLFDREL